MSELKYRVNFIPALEVSNESIKLEFTTEFQAKQALDAMTILLLFMQDNAMMNDFSNAAWIEKLVNGEWEAVDEKA